MAVNELPNQLKQIKERLGASDERLAYHLRLSVDQYRELEKGERVLPLKGRKRIEKTIERLLELCGME